MSTFTVPVVRIRGIEPIPGADQIELAIVGDYRSVILKGQFKQGDLAIYLPEGSVLPSSLIEQLGLTGRLAGSDKNRIKAIKLRGVVSQGILMMLDNKFHEEGDDQAEILGITKYEPPVPAHLSGEVIGLFGYSRKYDIENYKMYPDILVDGEKVEFSEKIHGSLCGVGLIPGLNHHDIWGGDTIVYSKGLGAKGLVFKDNNANVNNVYLKAAKSNDIRNRIKRVFPDVVVHVFGEVYGYGVQDLQYGRKDQGFAIFDICVESKYLNRDELVEAIKELGLPRVPVLYRGPFSKEIMYNYTSGRTVVDNGSHIREGIVITPVIERRNDTIGRVILKSVSGDYLTRKGDTTEFG
jgi:RNA ligase (TIGR02306 family)